MKRSEMIELIIDKLFYGKLAESARSDIRPKFITDLAEQDAESILKKLEEVGMLPPKACIERSVRVGDEQRTAYHNTNEWEPEDE